MIWCCLRRHHFAAGRTESSGAVRAKRNFSDADQDVKSISVGRTENVFSWRETFAERAAVFYHNLSLPEAEKFGKPGIY